MTPNQANKTLREILESMKRSAIGIGKTLAQDEDWVPVVQIVARDGRVPLIVMPDLQGDDRYKTTELLANILVSEEALGVAFVTTHWVIRVDQARMDAILAGKAPRASEAPDRQEQLSITTIDANGKVGGSVALIDRQGPHPTLAPWRDLPRGTDLTGDLIDPLKEAMKRVRES